MKQDPPPTPESPGTPVPMKKPWPLYRVFLAIAVFVVGYTFIMVFFRKETPMFYPYEEAQAEVLGNLLRSEGWEPLPEAYVIGEFRASREEIGLGARELLTFDAEETIGLEIGEHSTTPLVLAGVESPAALALGEPLQAEIHWEEKEEKTYPQTLSFYKRDGEILVFPPHGRIKPAVNAEARTRFLIPPEQLPSGDYTVYLYTEDGLRGWEFSVQE